MTEDSVRLNLKSYLNLYALLQTYTSSKEERRAFGLTQMTGRNKPLDQLLSWVENHQGSLKKPTLSETFSSYLYTVTLTLLIIGCVAGILSGIALLSYNGHEPVNVVYFMAMVIFLPLLTMVFTLLSIFKAQSAQSVLVHISPSYWMEKILRLLPGKIRDGMDTLNINPLLTNWLVIKRAQYISLFFSLGLLVSLLLVVATKDIAFAWSTTLQITPESFHRLLDTVAFPWRDVVPNAVPSLELIKQSQYFRLGDTLSEEMIGNASKLGEWWKFLAFSTLFYAIILRLLMVVISSIGLRYALKRSFMTLEGASTLLRDMNEPMISTHATTEEKKFVSASDNGMQSLCHLDASYDVLQGWAISQSQLRVMSDSMQIISPNVYEVGGGNSLEEDSEIISKSHGEVLLYVKAWEPPTMDFMDYLEELLQKVDKVIIYPVGSASKGYSTDSKFIDIWAKKLSLFKHEKVCLLDTNTKVADA